ncbi:hypothetical protein CEQ90_03875 [Lewinellaceae bacterium SD302]|nr:hypothetical protein CEQ90_03875 [Lewinellaceae bacterium SD302]
MDRWNSGPLLGPLVRYATVATLFLIVGMTTLTAQEIWMSINEADLPPGGDRRINNKSYRTYLLDTLALRTQLFAAPHEQFTHAEDSPTIITLPTSSGAMKQFRIVAYDLAEPATLAEYPSIRTWYGINLDNARQTIFLDWTERGFHASIRFGGEEDYNVDPLFRGDLLHYQVYDKVANIEAMPFECLVSDQPDSDPPSVNGSFGDCSFREYETAITATAEYSNYHGATSAAQSGLVHSAIVTTINRVNQVLTHDLALRLSLVENNSDLYYYDSATDPFDGTSPTSCLVGNTPNTNEVIGQENYDLGHIFSAGFSSGVAYLKSSCGGLKAGGVSGRMMPEGDPFNVDYVCHEIGHQLGANHIQNNNCNYNPNAGTEPGSGSTIMGYAGICEPNVQEHSDAYFNGRNLEEITAHLEEGLGNSCASVISTDLSTPTLESTAYDVIPKGTPFKLVGVGSGDGNLDYCWEQYDHEQGMMPPTGLNINGPLFRSYAPVVIPERYFPRLEHVRSGNDPEWEEIPLVGRSMDFLLTLRNSNAAYGCTANVTADIDVDGNRGPFLVTDPDQGNQYSAGQTAQVRWDLANTDQSPINCSEVEVLYSAAPDEEFVLLAGPVPNNGYTTVTIPNEPTSTARMMVRSVDNVFYNISTQDFTVLPVEGSPQVTIDNLSPSSLADCFDDGEADFRFITTSAGGATEPLIMQVNDLPQNTLAVFYPNPVLPGGTTDLTILGLDNLENGFYEMSVSGESAEATVLAEIAVNKTGGAGSPGPTLLLPADQDTEIDLRPHFQVADSGADIYRIEVATDEDFENIVFTNTSAEPDWVTSNYLIPQTTYYWRVYSMVGECGASLWNQRSFTTGNCYLYTSEAEAVTIPESSASVSMPVEVEDFGQVTDVDVYQLDIEHTYISDLNVELSAPNSSMIDLFAYECSGQNNVFISFDDDNGLDYFPCPPVDPAMFIQPLEDPLSTFDGSEANGEWILTVNDPFAGDGGTLNGFTLKICFDNYVPLPVTWLEFTATAEHEHIDLNWRTEAEKENLGFWIERTEDARNGSWEELDFVAATGEETGTYHYEDHRVSTGQTYFYRLRQEDTDGTVIYSPLRSARMGSAATKVNLYPNPVNDRLQYEWLSNAVGIASFQLRDLTGKILQTGTLNEAGGVIELRDLAAGVYLFRLDGPDGVTLRRIVKQ